MKKALFVLLVLVSFGVLGSCVSTSLDYPQPVFDKPAAYVIDANTLNGRIEDYVKLHNMSSDSNISFNVYVHDPDLKQWRVYGKGELKGNGDTDTIDTDFGDIDDYRYFAIESLNDKEYSYLPYKRSNDLHINILDK